MIKMYSEDSEHSAQSDKNSLKLWCICASTDTSRFMISCDKCNNWYHGDCVQISEKEANKIKKYYCLICMQKYPSLCIVLKRKYRDSNALSHNNKRAVARKVNHKKYRDDNSHFEASSDEWSDSKVASSKKSRVVRAKAQKPYLPDKQQHQQVLNSVSLPAIIKSGPRQCLGPGCSKAVYEIDTKYCSKQCGLKLAKARLEYLLPKSLDIEKPSSLQNGLVELSNAFSEIVDEKRIDELQNDKKTVELRLIQLEDEHKRLNDLINVARNCKPTESEAAAALKQDSQEADKMEQQICVVCCSEINMRHVLRHMERCFQKMEGSTVFCSTQKEQILGTPLFCDFYDPQTKAYCKRLRVVCEHFKDPKLPLDTSCGYPFAINQQKFCAAPRSKCTRHFGWERRKRALIDLEKYRNLIRMDEILQEDLKIKRNRAQRFSVLGALLHKRTFAKE